MPEVKKQSTIENTPKSGILKKEKIESAEETSTMGVAKNEKKKKPDFEVIAIKKM